MCQSIGYSDEIRFAKNVITYRAKKKVSILFSINLQNWKMSETFDIINDISENVTWVQLMYTIVNVNNVVSVFGVWIYDYN